MEQQERDYVINGNMFENGLDIKIIDKSKKATPKE